MKYDPTKHHRRSIRLKGYDYHNAGAYFVTICTKNRECVLDDPIINAIIHNVWYALPSWFPTIELDEFVVMPNHTHFVVWNNVGTPLAGILDAGNADEGAPNMDGGKPNMDGGAPNMDGGAPNMDGGKPNMDGGAPNMDGGAPNMDGGKPNMDEGAPNMDGGAPNMDGGAPNMDGGAPNMDGGKPNMDGGKPNMDGGKPNMDGGKPNMDGGAPNMDGGKPNMDGGKPRPYKIPKPQKINTAPALGDIVGAFKSLVFKVYLDWIEVNDPSRRAKFWQGNYYEHIIHNDRELNAIRQYIIDNPMNWNLDRDNLENIRKLPPPEKVEDYLEDLKQLMAEMDNQE